MSEYLIKFKAVIPDNFLGLFPRTFTGSEVYEANSAKEAMQKARDEFKEIMLGYDEEIEFSITDVSKI